jgi:hypothetical protein
MKTLIKECVPFNDDDNTALDAIHKYKPTIFCNGGDRNATNTPEDKLCNDLGIEAFYRQGNRTNSHSKVF